MLVSLRAINQCRREGGRADTNVKGNESMGTVIHDTEVSHFYVSFKNDRRKNI